MSSGSHTLFLPYVSTSVLALKFLSQRIVLRRHDIPSRRFGSTYRQGLVWLSSTDLHDVACPAAASNRVILCWKGHDRHGLARFGCYAQVA